ncbi:MAG TPA: hypothetical protein ENN81_02590 [Phycisphaerales bacterium]|nr:hypothetical protein [Phycisphaerales bacterium]
MTKDRTRRKDANDRREELLRPSRYLGYDRDKLGMYLMSRGAYRIAESQFRRAIWLNPFEYRFVVHLAWCLYRQGNHGRARDCLERLNVPADGMEQEYKTLVDRIGSNPSPDGRP